MVYISKLTLYILIFKVIFIIHEILMLGDDATQFIWTKQFPYVILHPARVTTTGFGKNLPQRFETLCNDHFFSTLDEYGTDSSHISPFFDFDAVDVHH